MAYLDDIIISSNSFENHMKHLTEVFNRLRTAGLKIKPSKCEFPKESLEYLGHIVSEQGISPNPKNRCNATTKTSTSVKEVRQFLGMAGFYQKFIKNYANVAQPLTALTGKYVKFHWSVEAEATFQNMKTCLQQTPVLAYLNLDKSTWTTVDNCDSSSTAEGAVLCQLDELENEKVICYHSQKFYKTQLKWPILEKEAFAIVFALQ